MKKWLIIVGALAIIIVVLFILLSKTGVVSSRTDPFNALPGDASVIFEFHEIRNQLEQIKNDSLWQNLKEYGLAKRVSGQFTALDSFFSLDSRLHNSFLKSGIWASLHKIKSDDYGLLFIMEENSSSHPDFNSIGKILGNVPGKRTYKGTDIFEFELEKYSKPFAITSTKGLIICSFEPYLVESAIAELRTGSNLMKGEKKLAQVRKFGEKNRDPKVYINFEHLPALLGIYVNSSFQETVKGLSYFADWVVLDYSLHSNSLFLNGYAFTGMKESTRLQFIEEGKIIHDITKILPYNTALFYAINTRSPEKLSRLTSIESNSDTLFNKYFLNWMGNNLGFAITEPYTERYDDDCYLMVSCLDTTLAKTQLKELSRLLFNVVEVAPDIYKSFEIYQLPDLLNLESTLGFRSVIMKDPFFTIINNIVVFGNSIAGIKVLIERYVEQQTLDKDIDYLKFRKQMTSNPAFNLYINTGRIGQLLVSIASDDLAGYLENNFDQFKSLNPIGIQFSKYTSNSYLVSGIIQSSTLYHSKTNLLWKTELDTIINMKPFVVKNHTNQKKEIFIQDLNNTSYLISNGGEIIWKRQLDAQIVGELYQVDYYNNNKLQYLFATQQSIYLIDRKGRFVENFPLKLPSKILGGLSIIDYDNNGKFRMFVSCDNGNTYGFEKSGKPLSGWSPRRNLGRVKLPVQYFMSETKDYIVLVNETGKLFFLSRRGDERINPVNLNATFNQPFSIEFVNNKETQLINADNRGRIYSINQTGKVSIDSFAGFSPPVKFLYGKILDDSIPSYIFLDNQKLTGYTSDKQLVYEYMLPDSIDERLNITIIPGSELPAIGIFSNVYEKIYVINSNGSLLEDFPLRGRSPFTTAHLLNENELILIVGTSDGTLTTYRIK